MMEKFENEESKKDGGDGSSDSASGVISSQHSLFHFRSVTLFCATFARSHSFVQMKAMENRSNAKLKKQLRKEWNTNCNAATFAAEKSHVHAN